LRVDVHLRQHVRVATSSPPPGFYDDPENTDRQRWWDGQGWTEVTQEAKSFPDVSKFAGGALIADGIIGFGPNRQGIFGSLVGIAVGIAMAVGIAVFIAPNFAEQNTLKDPVQVPATVFDVQRVTTQNVDERGQNTSTSISCSVVVRYTTQTGQEIESGTPYTSSSLCAYSPGQIIDIAYDASKVSRFQGLDATGDAINRWFPWIFVGVGVIIAVSSLWTLIVRATQIGGGIYLIRRSREKSRAKQARKYQ
jgi:hypothetical protein